MIESIQVEDGVSISSTEAVSRRLLVDAVNDIAKAIEDRARAKAPGSLSRTGVEVDYSGTGEFVGGLFPGVRFRGPGGRFVKDPINDTVVSAVISLPSYTKNRKAHWVHEGTGVHGPMGAPILPKKVGGKMVFQGKGNYSGRKYFLASTQGQEPQPYIDEAYHEIRGYETIRVNELRAQIAALT